MIDPTIAVHHGRVVKRTGDGLIVEFRSVVDAVKCAVEVQSAMVERNAGVAPNKRIEFRIGVHFGDVVEESDGDLMGDGVNIAARLEGIAKPGAICLSEDAYRQVSGRLVMEVTDIGPSKSRSALIRSKSASQQRRSLCPALDGRVAHRGRRRADRNRGRRLAFPRRHPRPARRGRTAFDCRAALLKALRRCEPGLSWRRSDRRADYQPVTAARQFRRLARTTAFSYRGKAMDVKQIGKELSVHYVLEGSAQRSGARVRVDAQLIDAVTGAHLWTISSTPNKPIS